MNSNGTKSNTYKMAKCHEHFLKISARTLAHSEYARLGKCRRHKKHPVHPDGDGLCQLLNTLWQTILIS